MFQLFQQSSHCSQMQEYRMSDPLIAMLARTVALSTPDPQVRPGDIVTVTATVTTHSGKGLGGVALRWSTSGRAGLSSTGTTTDAAGQTSVQVMAVAPEEVVVTASISGAPLSDSLLVDVGNSRASQYVRRVELSATRQAGDTFNVHAVLTDAQGQRVPGAALRWGVTAQAGIEPAVTTTDASGYAYATVTDQFAETVNVSAWLLNNTGMSGQVDLVFVPPRITIPDVGMKHGQFAPPLAITVERPAGTPLPDALLQLQLHPDPARPDQTCYFWKMEDSGATHTTHIELVTDDTGSVTIGTSALWALKADAPGQMSMDVNLVSEGMGATRILEVQ